MKLLIGHFAFFACQNMVYILYLWNTSIQIFPTAKVKCSPTKILALCLTGNRI